MKSPTSLLMILALLLVQFSAPLGWSQSVPSFAGHWALNAQKSSLSERASMPGRVELKVTQHSRNIECTWVLAPSVRIVLKFTTDGRPSFNPSGGNQEAFSSLVVTRQPDPVSPDIEASSTWKGRELRVRTYWMNRSKMGVELTDLWKLSSTTTP